MLINCQILLYLQNYFYCTFKVPTFVIYLFIYQYKNTNWQLKIH